jgi:LysM repeat protein
MADRNPARLAAPIALAAAAIAVAVIVAASGAGSSSGPDPLSPTQPVVTQPAQHVRPAPRSYLVKAGDTLSVIADKTGVSLETILRLNPTVDPQALQTGERLKLVP